ncbi:MAG: alkaline phosphatase family protein [Clostridia bacterium]|nr:alkaline phosphatase family protein [Clostridia bacterium]
MKNKVLLVLFDGARPDALEKCGHPFYEKFLSESAYTLNAQTVMPSSTLPCHFSLFTSTDPDLHGVKTNWYEPSEKWIKTLFQQLNYSGKTCSTFYNWPELQFTWLHPGAMIQSVLHSTYLIETREANTKTAEAARKGIKEYAPDFVFLYIGAPDTAGHEYNWMSKEYMDSLNFSFSLLEDVCSDLPDDYTVILMADHGGHDDEHGTECPEDMTIPIIIRGRGFKPGDIFENASIKDVAPTVTDIVGAKPYPAWEGESLLNKIAKQ